METAIQKSTKRDALSLTGSGALGTTKKKKIAVEEEEYNKVWTNTVCDLIGHFFVLALQSHCMILLGK